MKPRGYFGTFLYLAAASGLLFALLLSLVFAFTSRESFFDILIHLGLLAGLAFGVLFGAIMAIFMKAETLIVPFQDSTQFMTDLNFALARLGYHPDVQAGQFITYRPGVQSGILAPTISLQLNPGSATLIGPSMQIKKLKKLYRLI